MTERYFFPRAAAPVSTTLVRVDGAELACSARRDHGGPLLVHFHGNGEVVADYVPHLAAAYAERGIDTFFVEYRGYGASSGVPRLAEMLGDVPRVIDQLGVPLEQVFVYGRSIGSIYAIEAAHQRPGIGGLILESGIADVLERVLFRAQPEELGVTLQVLEEQAARYFDHEAKLRSYPGPVRVLHARGDRAVDPSHAERNARWAPRGELTLFPRGDHNTILDFHARDIIDAVEQLTRELRE